MTKSIVILTCFLFLALFSTVHADTYNSLLLTFRFEDKVMPNWDSLAAAVQQKFGACYSASLRMRIDQSSNVILLAAAQVIPAPGGCAKTDYEAVVAEGSLPGVIELISMETSSIPMSSDCTQLDGAKLELFCSEVCVPCPIGALCSVDADCVNHKCSKAVQDDAYLCANHASVVSALFATIIAIVAILF